MLRIMGRASWKPVLVFYGLSGYRTGLYDWYQVDAVYGTMSGLKTPVVSMIVQYFDGVYAVKSRRCIYNIRMERAFK